VTTPSRKTITVAMAAVALATGLGGCDLAKTGALPAGSQDVVTVLPLTFGSTTTLDWDEATLRALSSLGLTITPLGSAVVQSLGPQGYDFPITTGYVELQRDESHVSRAGASAAPDEFPAAVQPGWVQGSLYHEGSGIEITGPSGSASTASSGSASASTSAAPTANAVTTVPSVKLTDFVVDPGNSVLYATVDGQYPQVPLLSLDGRHLTASQSAPGAIGGSFDNTQGDITLSGTVASLTPQAAQLLDSTFGTTAITAGTELGTVQVAMTGEPVDFDAAADHVTAFSRLTGEGTTLTFEPSALSALSSLGITAAPTGAATASDSGAAVTFPITGGMVAIHSNKGFSPGYVVGSILHQSSGLALTDAEGATVATGNYVVDPGDSELYATVNGAINVPLFFLDGSHLTVTSSGGTVTLDGTVAELTDEGAQALDSTFGTKAFVAGMAIGTVHLVAQGLPGS
jgi:hypothetical protein